jgi:hypothetical protein
MDIGRHLMRLIETAHLDKPDGFTKSIGEAKIIAPDGDPTIRASCDSLIGSAG